MRAFFVWGSVFRICWLEVCVCASLVCMIVVCMLVVCVCAFIVLAIICITGFVSISRTGVKIQNSLFNLWESDQS